MDQNIERYVKLFFTVYAGLIGLNILIPFDLGKGISVAILMVSTYYASYMFVSDLSRIPNKSERRQLALGCLLSSYIVSLLYTFFIILYHNKGSHLLEFLSQPEAWFWGGVALVFVTLIYYFILNLSIRVFSKITFKKLKVE